MFNSEKGTINILDHKPPEFYSWAVELNEDRFSTELCAQCFVNNPTTTVSTFLPCTEQSPPTEIHYGPFQVPSMAMHPLWRSQHLQSSTTLKLPKYLQFFMITPGVTSILSPALLMTPHHQFSKQQKKQQCCQCAHTLTDMPVGQEKQVILVLILKPCSL